MFHLAHAADVRELLATEHGSLGLHIVFRYRERLNPQLDRDTLIHYVAPGV